MSSVETATETVETRVSPEKKRAPLFNRALDFVSSVKFGVVQLCILVALSILGMLIIQQNVNGFDAYYAGLTPAEKTVFGGLGLFDIYHSWYYNVLLLVLSLNIVLASIDRFPSAWSYIVKPKLSATANWLRARMATAELRLQDLTIEDATEKVAASMKRIGLKATVTENHVMRYDGEVSGGTFSISFDQNGKTGTTGPIPFNATASEVKGVLTGQSDIGDPQGSLLKPKEVFVTGTLNTSMRITKPMSPPGEDRFSFLVDDTLLTGAGKIIASRENTAGVFGESGKWNRLGAYIVHVCLLTLFLGHFVALQTGFDADVGFQPGQTTSEIELIQFDLDQQNRFAAALPFSITCTDIRQKLIDPNGSIEVFNTLDWVTSIKINDPAYGVTEADVGLNRPFSYRGYRFFQAQTVPIGNARTISLTLTPENGGKPVSVEIKRTGSATLEDGTLIKYEEFLPDFTFNQDGQADTRSGDYNNPAAVLNVTPKNDQPVRVFAFAADLASDMPVGAAKAGYKWKLTKFEKSPRAHILSIKYDPYNGAFIAWYFGGIGLIGALIYVFFFSHRRVWAMINETDTGYGVILGGETNRNHQGFEEKFGRLTANLEGKVSEKGTKGD